MRAQMTYDEWRHYLIDQCGDLRALDPDTADKLYDNALEHHDNEMIEALETFFG